MNRQQRRALAKRPKAPAVPRADTPARYFEAGLRLLKAGQLLDAEQCGKHALALDGEHADSLHLMGVLSMLSKRPELAIEWFAQAIRQDQTVADLYEASRVKRLFAINIFSLPTFQEARASAVLH